MFNYFFRDFKFLTFFLFIGSLSYCQVSASNNIRSFEDEITFFNVGQGHAALIHKGGIDPDTNQPYVPLLIDAGSKDLPYISTECFEWEKYSERNITLKIANKIKGFWPALDSKDSDKSPSYKLNIIITHQDADHQNFVEKIIEELNKFIASENKKFNKAKINSLFTLLIGGLSLKNLLKQAPDNTMFFYSDDLLSKKYENGLIQGDGLSIFKESGCIDYIFCPNNLSKFYGNKSNGWSIVTRINFGNGGMSAIFPGDATFSVKKVMLEDFKKKGFELKSDILLVPHHGAADDEKDDFSWEKEINPKVIIIGAGIRKEYYHPKGEIIDKLLKNNEGSIFKATVEPHGMLYFCKFSKRLKDKEINLEKQESFHDSIVSQFKAKEKMFDAQEIEADNGKCHLAWVNIPLYTLWATGTIQFKNGWKDPIFIDAPRGLSHYIAVPDPLYLFPPESRKSLMPLTTKDNELVSNLMDRITKIYDKNKNSISNSMQENLLLLNTSQQRGIYLELLNSIFSEGIKYKIENFDELNDCFSYLKDAVSERYKHDDPYKCRITRAVETLINNSVLEEEKKKVDSIAFILKYFLRGRDDVEELGNYVKHYNNLYKIFSSNKAIEIRCPTGFYEWKNFLDRVGYSFNEIFKGFYFDIEFDDNLSIKEIKNNHNEDVEEENFFKRKLCSKPHEKYSDEEGEDSED
jgi:hypothetical protein